MNRKRYFQPSAWVIQPMSGANNTAAEYCAELKTAAAVQAEKIPANAIKKTKKDQEKRLHA